MGILFTIISKMSIYIFRNTINILIYIKLDPMENPLANDRQGAVPFKKGSEKRGLGTIQEGLDEILTSMVLFQMHTEDFLHLNEYMNNHAGYILTESPQTRTVETIV